MIPALIANIWLGKGLKYTVSSIVAGRDWDLPFHATLRKHGITLNHVDNLRTLIDVFAGKIFWKPDGWFQLKDLILPPVQLLTHKGDDCDGSAMLWAQAVRYALGPQGWKAGIVSYLAQPFVMSHHVAVAVSPDKKLWPIQPPSQNNQEYIDPLWPEPCYSWQEVALVIAASYPKKPRVRAFDVRSPNWHVIQPWRHT